MKNAVSEMLRRVALVITDGSEERSSSIVRMTITIFLHSVLQFLVTANIPSSPIFITPMLEAIHSSVTSVLTRAARHSIKQDAILKEFGTL
jgi:hypothetical protein